MGLRDGYRAFNTALDLLYDKDTLNLEGKKKPFKFKDKVFMDAAEKVYKEGGFDLQLMNTQEAKAVISETARVLSEAISSGIPHEVPATLQYALENNAFIFSGFKTFHSLREIGLSMMNDKGAVKPFGEFLTDARKINKKYNQNYLYAEYNHAVGTSLMAVKWNDFTQDGDRYDLQYRTAGDNHVREEHAAMHGITLPVNDPFWDKYFPPNGWNCRCTAVQVRKGKYPVSDPAKAMKAGDDCTSGIKREMFRYNPGKAMELFPPKHPYYKAPKEAKRNIKHIAEYEHYSHDPNFEDVFYDEKTGGITAKHILHNFDKVGGEYEKNVRDAGVAAGHSVIFGIERGDVKNLRSTEGLWDGLQFEVAGRETGTINNIKRGLEHCADKKTTEIAILDFPKGNFNIDNLNKAIARYKGLKKLGDGQFVKFKKIICTQNKQIVYEADL